RRAGEGKRPYDERRRNEPSDPRAVHCCLLWTATSRVAIAESLSQRSREARWRMPGASLEATCRGVIAVTLVCVTLSSLVKVLLRGPCSDRSQAATKAQKGAVSRS